VDKMIEVRYAGVVIGRTAIVRELDTRGVFLGITEPMPVGTPVSLRIGDQPVAEAVQGKVDAVSESQELAGAGMRVRFAEPRSAALFGSPKPAAPEPEPEIVPEVMDAAPAAARPVVASASVAADASRDAGAPGAAGPTEAGHRRIVVDASTEKDDAAVPESASGDEGDLSTSVGGETGRIPAPDALAFGAGGGGGMGKKGRRNKRR
jgi:hypothetical protein